jgi:hypothetical protein
MCSVDPTEGIAARPAEVNVVAPEASGLSSTSPPTQFAHLLISLLMILQILNQASHDWLCLATLCTILLLDLKDLIRH